jgi:ribosomal protein S18 acetylase RimI-like enzyme
MTSVRRATAADLEACVAVLASLPDYFTPDTHDDVRSSWTAGSAWVAVDGEPDSVVGFALVQRSYERSAEITYAAVLPDRRRFGIGSELVAALVDDLRIDTVFLIEVKTLDAAAGYEPYVATRAFWEPNGFVQIDCIDPLPGWQPGNPSAIYVRALDATPA